MEASDDGVVAWDVAPTDTAFGRCCAYALVGITGGFALLVIGLVVLAVAVSASADPEALALVVVLAAIGATSTTDGADVLYLVAGFPTLFGVLFLALAGRKNA